MNRCNTSVIQTLDFTPHTRESDSLQTVISLQDSCTSNRVVWIKAGCLSRLELGGDGRPGRLGCRHPHGTTDFEHDSSWAFSFGIIGVSLNYVENGWSHFKAWVEPNFDTFKVPVSVVDPKDIEGSWQCGCCDEPHLVLPDGHYVPKGDPNLFKLVMGCPIDISFGPRRKD